MKKVYEPGEMFHAAYYRVGIPVEWGTLSWEARKAWADREKCMIRFFPQFLEKDEQTDDSSGMFIE